MHKKKRLEVQNVLCQIQFIHLAKMQVEKTAFCSRRCFRLTALMHFDDQSCACVSSWLAANGFGSYLKVKFFTLESAHLQCCFWRSMHRLFYYKCKWVHNCRVIFVIFIHSLSLNLLYVCGKTFFFSKIRAIYYCVCWHCYYLFFQSVLKLMWLLHVYSVYEVCFHFFVSVKAKGSLGRFSL